MPAPRNELGRRRRKPVGYSSSRVKSQNLRAVLISLLRNAPVSRVRLARLTGLSTATITNLITELMDQGIVAQEGTVEAKSQRGVGRPRTALRLVADARHAVGVHIGVGSVRIGITDLRANPLLSLSLAHPIDHSPEEVLAKIVNLVNEAIAQSGVALAKVIGIGVGASGLVDPQSGVNVVAPNLGWRDVPIRDWLRERLQLPVWVDNNVRAMALAEALFGAGQEARTLAFVYGRIGVGAGFVVDGQLYRGSGAGAGEVGHMTIIPNGGEPCRCGSNGCLETLVSEPAIIRLAQELAEQQPDGILATTLKRREGTTIERIFAAARNGDAATRALLNDRARYMGIALANLVNVFSPEVILLGGIFSQGQDLLLPAVELTMRRRAFANLGERVRLQSATFGRQAGMIGAAALALNAFLEQQPEAA
jgi:glucokinase-like ROK family protein